MVADSRRVVWTSHGTTLLSRRRTTVCIVLARRRRYSSSALSFVTPSRSGASSECTCHQTSADSLVLFSSMLALQETKLSKLTYFLISCMSSSIFLADLAGAALGEGGGGKLEKLSVKQLKAVRSFQPIQVAMRSSRTLRSSSA